MTDLRRAADILRAASLGCAVSQLQIAMHIVEDSEQLSDEVALPRRMVALAYGRLAATQGDPAAMRFAATLSAYIGQTVGGTPWQFCATGFHGEALGMLDVAAGICPAAECEPIEQTIDDLSAKCGADAAIRARSFRRFWDAVITPDMEHSDG